MKDILIKSLVIAILASISGSVLSDVLFAMRTETYVFSEKEMKENENLTVQEFTKKYGNTKIISGLDYVLNYPTSWSFWQQKLKVTSFYFVMIFISCISSGYWKYRKSFT